ncbi:MAG: mismatch-specific DNA-glycosylase [Xanthomonadales bacterium]|nr:mismatch-specific DNA-glycosylase [Xanthomonadales bacterium]
MGFTREELEAHRGEEVDDLLGEDPQLLLVGINPGLWTAATNTHFAHPGNRFYPALHLAGITGEPIDPSGATDRDRAHLKELGIAITNLVPRATARASELTREELREGGEVVARKVEAWAPHVVAFVGITAYRDAYRRRKARTGRQPEEDWIAGTETWVVPNPSGLNAHETIESLARHYRGMALAAGLDLGSPRW